ncbi:hypothetical protein WEH80_40680 [Actinomycetes bacterium KLBMP 9759]
MFAYRRTDRDPGREPTRASGASVIGALVTAPLFATSIALLIRSGVFSADAIALTDEQLSTSLTFIAAAFATTVTVLGLVVTQAQGRREHARQRLETAAKGLELLTDGDAYAPSARVAGGLASLVYLGHPVIAVRSLTTAWSAGAVDNATAVWLVGEVYRSGTAASKIEASMLLRARAATLTESATGSYHWPQAIREAWRADLPLDARINNFLALITILTSQDRSWWRNRHVWAVALLDEVIRTEPRRSGLAAEAILLQRKLLSTLSVSPGAAISWRRGWKTIRSVWNNLRTYERRHPSALRIHAIEELDPLVATWLQPDTDGARFERRERRCCCFSGRKPATTSFSTEATESGRGAVSRSW